MNEVPNHPGWHYTTIDPHPDGGLETEVYFQNGDHHYPGIIVRGCNRAELLHNTQKAIDRQHRLLSAKL
jgi:hypothetical protein